MLEFFSSKRLAAIIPGDAIVLDDTERKIFAFIREACGNIPQHPTVRVAGGWVRDKLLGKPSKDIDITVDTMTGVEFGNALLAFSRRPDIVQKYGTNIVGTVKDTEARPEQIKNLAVAFTRIYGQDIEVLPLRGIEEYQPGNRNPKVINIPELSEIARIEGIPKYLQGRHPELYEKLSLLLPQDRNNPVKVMPILDAHRRDLTINSLFYNVSTGNIDDYTRHGYDDLATMTLRTPLDPIKTFTDDPLRVLRVLRFHSKYANSKISPEVIEAIKNPDVQFQITRRIQNPKESQGIVVERTSQELRKMMQGQQPDAAIRIMYQTGLLSKLLNLPKGFHSLDMDQRNKWHSLPLVEHTLQVMKHVNRLSKEYGFTDEQRMMMNLGSLFHDLGKLDERSHKNKPGGTRGYSGNPDHPQGVPHQIASYDIFTNFAQALQLSNDETVFIGNLVKGHMKPHDHSEEGITDKALRRYIRENPNWVFQYVHAMADAMSKDTSADESLLDPYKQNLTRIRELAPTADQYGRMAPSTDLLNGQEIMQIVGLPPKPPVGLVGYIEVVKERIRDTQDGNPNLTKPEAMAIVQNMVSSGELDKYKQRV